MKPRYRLHVRRHPFLLTCFQWRVDILNQDGTVMVEFLVWNVSARAALSVLDYVSVTP